MMRKLLLPDKEIFAGIMRRIHQFTDEERDCALELIGLNLEQRENFLG